MNTKSESTIPLDDDDALAAALGRLLGHWAVCEHELMGVLSVALGIEIDKARFIWQAFPSALGKIELLQKVNLHFTTDSARQSALEPLLKTAGDLNTERNGFSHATQVQTVIDRIAGLSASLNRWSSVRHV